MEDRSACNSIRPGLSPLVVVAIRVRPQWVLTGLVSTGPRHFGSGSPQPGAPLPNINKHEPTCREINIYQASQNPTESFRSLGGLFFVETARIPAVKGIFGAHSDWVDQVESNKIVGPFEFGVKSDRLNRRSSLSSVSLLKPPQIWFSNDKFTN